MDRLILFRHGKALSESESGQDFDRRLAGRGVTDSAEMAARLADLGFRPDLVLVSPAVRTRETWAAAEPAFPGAEVRFDQRLYHADTALVLRMATEAGESGGTVMIVGHNPGLQDLTVKLLAEGGAPAGLVSRAQQRFPPAAAAAFLMGGARPVSDGLVLPERRG